MKEKIKEGVKLMKKSTFFKDFKAFISRGNVVDMAVGVVIGGSFGKIVTGLVNYIINPLVGIFAGSGDLDSVKTVITEATEDTAEVAILWGSWLQTIIDFLITAFCIFFVLRILTKARAKLEEKKLAEEARKAEEEKAKAEEAAKAEADQKVAFKESIMKQEQILAEIRDLLQKKA